METILVIDDEPFMRRLCDDMLSLRGFKVLTAESAKEGLAKLEQGGIDVVLLDIMMPELSGIEFLPIVKKTDPFVYVIIMTAYASLESAIEALKKGAYDYLRKPFRPHELYHSVDRAIGRRRVELENRKLLQDLQRKVQELSTLNRVGQSIHSLLEIDRLLERIVLSIAAVMEVEIVSLMLIEKETNEMTIRAATGLPEEITKTTRQKVGTGIAGWVAQHREPLLVDDIEQDLRFARRENLPRYRTKSLLSVPLITKAGVIGVLNVNSKVSGEPFTEHDLELLTTFASQASSAIENAELYAEIQGFNRKLEEEVRIATAELAKSNTELELKVKELRTLYEASRVMTSTLDPQELATKMLEEVGKLIPNDRAEIWVFDEAAGELKVLATSKEAAALIPQGGVRLDDRSSTAWISRNREALLIREIKPGLEVSTQRWLIGDKPVRSYIGVPLLKGDRLVGTLELASRTLQAFHEGHLDTLKALASHLAMAVENARLYSEIERTFIDTLSALANSLEAKDDYTMNHSERVTQVALLIGKQMGLSPDRLRAIEIGGRLHDVGKIGVADEVLKSANKLTPEEKRIMDLHPSIGARILEPIQFLKGKGVKEVVVQHQERYDGTGYPQGLKGEEIDLGARILAVADAYDAMMSRRRYRRKIFTHEDIVGEFKRNAGTQFDPKVVEAFLQIEKDSILDIYPLSASSFGGLLWVECERCGAQFRVDGQKIPVEGTEVKCARCQHPITVKPQTTVSSPSTSRET
ncbi:MAG: zinc-ribbon domain-containing protein [candidate division NC10 bacterium]|nr:zinc-ribbon domain-containing protein [candidate division NC10 bacterium]